MLTNFNKKQIIFLAIFLITIIGLLIFIIKKNKTNSSLQIENQSPTQTEIPEKPTETQTLKTGFFNLGLPSDKTRFSIDEEIELILIADSSGKKVTAYDVLLGYQEAGFDLISVNNLTTDFSFLKFKKPNLITLTAVKKPEVTREIIFSSQKIFSLKFKPKQKGRFEFEVISAKEKEKTQFVDQENQIYYPQTNKISIEIY